VTFMVVDDIPPIMMQNVVATFNLDTDRMDLARLAKTSGFVEYNPRKFAAATCRIIHPRTTALCFASGNMVVTGARDEIHARLAARKYVRVFRMMGLDVRFRGFKIQNLVASAKLPGVLDLDSFANVYGAGVSYEPDMFPGLILRIPSPKVRPPACVSAL
jgi:transcription initiation factor TFIID TATA-box-binding protein